MKAFHILTVILINILPLSSNSQQITVSGNKFLVWGKEIFMNGANTPLNNWNDFGGNYKSSWWDSEFQRIKNAGGNSARIWISCNGDVGLTISTLAVYFPDVLEMYQILLMAWMYLSPIMYPEEIIPARYLGFYRLNPLYWIIKLFRALIYEGRVPLLSEIWPAVAWAFGALFFGWIFFASKSDEYAYRIWEN